MIIVVLCVSFGLCYWLRSLVYGHFCCNPLCSQAAWIPFKLPDQVDFVFQLSLKRLRTFIPPVGQGCIKPGGKKYVDNTVNNSQGSNLQFCLSGMCCKRWHTRAQKDGPVHIAVCNLPFCSLPAWLLFQAKTFAVLTSYKCLLPVIQIQIKCYISCWILPSYELIFMMLFTFIMYFLILF